MSLILYAHPLSSYCHKVLIALYENGTPFELRFLEFPPGPNHAELKALWPKGSFPVIRDGDRVLPEASVIIEYLDLRHPGPVPLIPADPDARIDMRFWDRVFDLYVQGPLQAIVKDLFLPDPRKDPEVMEHNCAALRLAWGLIDERMKGRTFVAGDAFSAADCAAVPALFYGGIMEPWGDAHPHLDAYFERLLTRPSVVRVLEEARPFFGNFPFQEKMPARFR